MTAVAMIPHTCVFFPKATRSGVTPKCWKAHMRTGSAESGLNLVEDEECLVLVRDPAQLPQELAAEVIVASLSLDRLDEDRGDSVGISIERRLDLRNEAASAGGRRGLVQRIMDFRIRDAGPIERREIGRSSRDRCS